MGKLQKNVNKLKQANDALNSEVEDLRKTSIEAQNVAKRSRDRTDALLDEKEALLNELHDLQAEVSRLDKEIVSDKIVREAAAKETIILSGELTALKAKLDKTRAENESLKKKLDDTNKRYIVLENENIALRTDNTKIATKLDSCKLNLSTADNDLDKCKNLRSKLYEEIYDLRKILGDAEMKIRFLEGQLTDLSNEKERIEKEAKAQAAFVKAYADDARIQLDDLFKDLNAEKTDRNAALRELNALKNALVQFLDDLNRYQRENERLTIELTTSEDRAIALRADL